MTTHDDKARELAAAPLESYSPEDRAFFKFWYSHMVGDVISGPVCGVSYRAARYIWDAARAALSPASGQNADYAALEREHLGDPNKRTGIYAAPAQQAEKEGAA